MVPIVLAASVMFLLEGSARPMSSIIIISTLITLDRSFVGRLLSVLME